MAVVDTDPRRTRAARSYPGLRNWRAAKSDGCARALSVLRWQGHAVSHPRHQPAGIYWPRHLLGMHSHDQRGRDRPLQSRQGRHDCRCPRANLLEPISKSFEEDHEAGELDEAEEVLAVVFPADEDAALPLDPGEEAFDEPTSHVTA